MRCHPKKVTGFGPFARLSNADLASPTTSKGGYRVLGPLADVAIPEGECGNILRIILRDFQSSHDDFENAADWSVYQVQSPIDDTRKPVSASRPRLNVFVEMERVSAAS